MAEIEAFRKEERRLQNELKSVGDELKVLFRATSQENKKRQEDRETRQNITKQARDENRKKSDAKQNQINEVRKKLDAATLELRDLRREKEKAFDAREERRMIESRVGSVKDEIYQLEKQGKKLETEISELKTNARKVELKHPEQAKTSKEQKEKEIKSLEKQIAKAAGKDSLIQNLEQQKSKKEKEAKHAEEYWNMIDSLYDKQTLLEKIKEQHIATTQKLDEFTKKKSVIGDAKIETAQYQNRIKELNALITKHKTELKKLQDQRKAIDSGKEDAKDAHDAEEETPAKPAKRERERSENDKKIDELKEKQRVLNKELDDLKASVPITTFQVDSDYARDIIGKGGSRIQELQNDFGVYIKIDDSGLIKLQGAKDKAEPCKEAILQIIENAKQEKKNKVSIKLPRERVADIIGRGGATIKSIQTQTNTRINLVKDKQKNFTGAVEIFGDDEGVAAAQKMIQETLDSQHQEIIHFDTSFAPLLTAEKRTQLQSEAGVSYISISREQGAILVGGPKQACHDVKDRLESFFSNMSDSKVEIRIDDTVYNLLLQDKGSKIQKIRKETATVVNMKPVTDNSKSLGSSGRRSRQFTLTITGPEEGVNAAKERVSELMKEGQEIREKEEKERKEKEAKSKQDFVKENGENGEKEASPEKEREGGRGRGYRGRGGEGRSGQGRGR